MTKEFTNPLEETMHEFIHLVSSFDENVFNTIPFEGSWTAAQVAEHINLSNSGMTKIIEGPVKDTERSPDKLIAGIKESFLNFSIKMRSPDFVVPGSKSYLKDHLLDSLKKAKTDLTTASEHADLTKTCMEFEFPQLGYLTRMEIISFVLFHTQRHTHQLQNIYNVLKEKQFS